MFSAMLSATVSSTVAISSTATVSSSVTVSSTAAVSINTGSMFSAMLSATVSSTVAISSTVAVSATATVSTKLHSVLVFVDGSTSDVSVILCSTGSSLLATEVFGLCVNSLEMSNEEGSLSNIDSFLASSDDSCE